MFTYLSLSIDRLTVKRKELSEEYVFEGSLNKTDIQTLKIKDGFVKEILEMWSELKLFNFVTVQDLSQKKHLE